MIMRFQFHRGTFVVSAFLSQKLILYFVTDFCKLYLLG